MSSESLVRMANQISISVPLPDQAAELTAAHIRSFWTPAMIAQLADHAAGSPDDLRPGVLDALGILGVIPGRVTHSGSVGA